MAVGKKVLRTAVPVLAAAGLMTGVGAYPAHARTVHVDVDVDATLTCDPEGGAQATYTLTNQGAQTIHLDEVAFALRAPSSGGLTTILVRVTPIMENQTVAPGASMTLSGVPFGDGVTDLSGRRLQLTTYAVNDEDSTDGIEWEAPAVFAFDGC